MLRLDNVITHHLSDFPTPLEPIFHPMLTEKYVQVLVKRDDMIHPVISGNKWRKIKYNLIKAFETNQQTLLTFGGAHSNHIAATAAVGNIAGLQTIGVIRGNWQKTLSPTLTLAESQGMRFHFVSTEDYRKRAERSFISALEQQFGKYYFLPEGGTNELALEGCKELAKELESQQVSENDYIVTAVGTGGTFAGIAAATKAKVLGVSVLKNASFLAKEVELLWRSNSSKNPVKNWTLLSDYHFGGYAKMSPDYINFLKTFMQTTGLILDPIYTGKAMYALFDQVAKNQFRPESKVVFIHTGGLQGIPGMITRYPALQACYANKIF